MGVSPETAETAAASAEAAQPLTQPSLAATTTTSRHPSIIPVSAGGAEGFERVFDVVGGHGIFQWRLLFITALQLMVLIWHHIGYTFLGSVPDHWCTVPELQETNWTLEQIKMISIPRIDNHPVSTEDEPTNQYLYEKCEYFNLDYSTLLQNSNNDFQQAYSQVNWGNVTKSRCSEWSYDKSIYEATVATEFNLVCDNRWMAATIQGSYMAGGLIGTLSAGSLSDKFLGRRRTVLISLALVIIGGILAAFSTSYLMFLLLRLVISIGVSGSMQNCFVLMTEHSDKKYRAFLGIVSQVPFAIGYMILPGLAYRFRDWSNLQLSFGILSTGLVVYYWILPESPRWLATHGETERAIGALNRIARVNRLPRPNRRDLEEIVSACSQVDAGKKRNLLNNSEKGEKPATNNTTPSGTSKKSNNKLIGCVGKGLKGLARNFKSLMTTGEIRKRSFVFWFLFGTVAMVYYGIVFSGNLTSDPFLLVFLSGLMEVPAYTVIVPFVSKLGRRPTTSATFILTGICMLGLAWSPNKYEVIRIVLAMSAKLFISSGFAIIYLLGAELYPTELRTTGLAVGIFMGRAGAISAPYIVDLMQNVYKDLPTVIFGVVSVIAGFVSLLLPETKTLEMSDKVIEIELRAEGEKAKERERRMSWVGGD